MQRRAFLLDTDRKPDDRARRTKEPSRRLGVRIGFALALAGLWTGCGDDDVRGTTDPVGEPNLRPDAAVVLPRLKVTNAGEPCAASEGCNGELPQCLTTSPAGTTYPGGYCTADCKNSTECGPGAECPVADAETLEPDYPFTSTWARKCFKSCTLGKNECRIGYECESLADAYRARDAPAPMHRTVCVPRGGPLFGVDAGTPIDGGARRDAGSRMPSDAGLTEADAGAGLLAASQASGLDAGRVVDIFRPTRE